NTTSLSGEANILTQVLQCSHSCWDSIIVLDELTVPSHSHCAENWEIFQNKWLLARPGWGAGAIWTGLMRGDSFGAEENWGATGWRLFLFSTGLARFSGLTGQD